MHVRAVSFSTGGTDLLSDTVLLTEWSPALQKLALLSCSGVICAETFTLENENGRIVRKISRLETTRRQKKTKIL
jgi:hypothetical protein